MAESDGHIPTTSQVTTAPERPASSPARAPAPRADATPDPDRNPRGELAKAIPRRPRVSWWLGVVFAVAFAALVVPAVTANRWLASLGASSFEAGEAAPVTIRVAPFSGYDTEDAHIGGGGIVIARGRIADASQRDNARAVIAATPRGPLPYVAFFMLAFVLGAIFTHHMRRSIKGRLVRVQIVSLVSIAILALAVKFVMLTTATSVLVVPVALFAIVPTLVLDRIVGLATGILAAVVTSLLIPFDVGVALLLLVASSTAGLVVAEHPKYRWRAVVTAGAVTTLFTAGTYVLLAYVTKGELPAIGDPLRSPLVAAVLGPAIATVLAVPLVPLYQLLVGEITRGKLIELEDLSNPLLSQIAERAPGTWQHSLMMANLAEIAANAIGASGRLVRVGAYYHDLGKSLQPKYFIENLEPGETSPHDQLPPEVSCDAIFAHVTGGILTARKAGLHERIVDFMHMHHGNGVLEYFWAKCREHGNPNGFTIEAFRYPGHPPQSRETAILAICDAVEAASRTLKKPDATAIDSLVQRIVYGKLHLGQLDESGLSMSDLRRISDSLRETIRHANHGRIEYPWQKAQQDASAGANPEALTATGPRLDSLDRYPRRDTAVKPIVEAVELEPRQPEAKVATPPAGQRRRPTSQRIQPTLRSAETAGSPADALAATADLRKPDELAIVETAPAIARDHLPPARPGRPRTESERAVLLGPPPGVITPAMFGGEPPPAARKRAATLPPTMPRRAPTVPPPSPVPGRKSPTLPPIGALAGRSAGPPPAVDLENAITNPPPLRRTLEPPAATRLPAVITGAPRPPPAFDDDDASITGRRAAFADPGRTDPSLPVMTDASPASDPAITLPGNDRDPKWAAGLAARIDAQLESDEWSIETPVVAPTKAELRALLGVPDPTRKQSLDEIERLHAAAIADRPSEPEILQRRPAPGTAEVDPDDIEAAIELAPPARRNAIAIAKPKKPQ